MCCSENKTKRVNPINFPFSFQNKIEADLEEYFVDLGPGKIENQDVVALKHCV